MASPAPHCASLLGPLVVLATCLPAQAGLSFDAALQRHRAQLAVLQGSAATLSSATPLLDVPDSVAIGVANDPVDGPRFQPPVAGSRLGVQFLKGGSVDRFAWRLGLGWADAEDPHFDLSGSELGVPSARARRTWGSSGATGARAGPAA